MLTPKLLKNRPLVYTHPYDTPMAHTPGGSIQGIYLQDTIYSYRILAETKDFWIAYQVENSKS